jgi:hypothetical protein
MIEIRSRDGAVLHTVDADTLRRANLYGANLREADLYVADLYGANLYGANLRGADLYGANLRGADLRGADLRDADLRDADLRDADLRGADLRDAYLDQCKQYIAFIRGSRHSIVVIDDDIRIGCQRMTLGEWLDKFESVGREAGYTEQQITEYGIYLKAIRDVLEVRKNETTNR